MSIKIRRASSDIDRIRLRRARKIINKSRGAFYLDAERTGATFFGVRGRQPLTIEKRNERDSREGNHSDRGFEMSR